MEGSPRNRERKNLGIKPHGPVSGVEQVVGSAVRDRGAAPLRASPVSSTLRVRSQRGYSLTKRRSEAAWNFKRREACRHCLHTFFKDEAPSSYVAPGRREGRRNGKSRRRRILAQSAGSSKNSRCRKRLYLSHWKFSSAKFFP